MFKRLRHPSTVACCVIFVTGLMALRSTATEQPSTKPARHDLFAFCHDTHDACKRDLPQQANMLKKLGYDGAGHVGLEKITQRIDTLDKVGLRLYLAGVTINLKQDLAPQLAAFRAALPALKQRQLVLYTVVTGLPTGVPEGVPIAVAAVRQLSQLATQAGVRIGIYPHTGDWVATVPQAVKLAKLVDRDNCGVIFNLCHFLRNEPLESLDQTLDLAAPYLIAVTINGADLTGKNDKDWSRLIQPLDQGTFDLADLLHKLDQRNYTGPIGIMCYGIGGDAQVHLARSIKAWRKLNAR